MQIEISDPSVYFSIDNCGGGGGRKQDRRSGTIVLHMAYKSGCGGSYTPSRGLWAAENGQP
jgi:hypothetical protein